MSSTTQLPRRAVRVLTAPATEFGSEEARARSWRIAGIALAVAPAVLIGYLAYRTGGYYPEAYSSVLVVFALALGGAAVAARRPFAGLSAPLLIAVGALFLLVVWTWFSSEWSDTPIRALLESQRTTLYMLTLLFFGAFLRRPGSLSLAVTALAAVIAGICATSVATRLYPDVFTTSAGLAEQRLAFPLSYWNSLGMFAGIGLVLLVHLSSDLRTRPPVRVLAAAAIPITAVTLYFTFSRGATGALLVGLVAYLLAGWPRGALCTALAAAPATALAVTKAYSADLLSTRGYASSLGAAQGHRVASWLIAACLVAGLLRAALIPLDKRLQRLKPASAETKRKMALGAVVAVLLGGVLAIALDAPGRVNDAYHQFAQNESPLDARTRLHEVSLNGREDQWKVSLEYYRADHLKGSGAGTFETEWFRSRPTAAASREGHSLYIEILGEMGLVGFLLIVTAVSAVLVGLLARARGRRRPLYGALFAATLMWALHAGVDWDWEIPAVGLSMFALAGLALARPQTKDGAPARVVSSWPFRIAVVVACLLVGVTAVRTVIADAAVDEAKRALGTGNCRTATADARTAISAVETHPTAYEVLGYCNMDAGRNLTAVRRMRKASQLDPYNWRYWYGLGLARAAAGLNPHEAIARAHRLNPLAPILEKGPGARLASAERRQWKRLAAAASRPSN